MTTVKDVCTKYQILYNTNMESYAKEIITIMNGNIIETNDGILLNWNGLYHRIITKNYTESKKYYLMSIEHSNVDAMHNLGNYYKNILNYDEMKKYYLMAIEHGNSNAMYNLGYYYKIIEKNYVMMKKYLLMAIEHGNSIAMFKLGHYYDFVDYNYNLMKKYYLMSIKHGTDSFMEKMKLYCRIGIRRYI